MENIIQDGTTKLIVSGVAAIIIGVIAKFINDRYKLDKKPDSKGLDKGSDAGNNFSTNISPIVNFLITIHLIIGVNLFKLIIIPLFPKRKITWIAENY